jgi:hypothetical protein
MGCHEQHESHRVEHAGERPFATIKSQFGARGFLTRGLAKVRCEWHWLTSAFNLHRPMSLIAGNAGNAGLPAASTES